MVADQRKLVFHGHADHVLKTSAYGRCSREPLISTSTYTSLYIGIIVFAAPPAPTHPSIRESTKGARGRRPPLQFLLFFCRFSRVTTSRRSGRLGGPSWRHEQMRNCHTKISDRSNSIGFVAKSCKHGLAHKILPPS